MRIKTTESYIEKRVCKYAKDKGWLVYKFQSPAQRGVPDRIFLKQGKILFIEFKAPGKQPTKQQLYTHERFVEQGFGVFVIDSFDAGKVLFDG